MATAVSKPPSGPRMKRPPVANVQTGTNGAKPAGTATSSSTPSKRPPGSTTPTAASASNASTSQRGAARRASQRPADASGKQSRPSKTGDAGIQAQRAPEPYVKTTEYILSKYAKKQPSLVVHLHPTHFRFDQQDGSWSYQSQMKVILECIKQQTIPADFMDELLRSGVTFYDGCLIVQIRDHRYAAATKEKVSKAEQKENNQPFSMHKHSKFLVPSPFVPYPLPKQASQDDSNTTGDSKSQAAATASSTKPAEKEAGSQSDPAEERVFTTVLFPTQTNMNLELIDFAQWVDNFTYQRSKKLALTAKSPGAAVGAPPAKRQKMLSDVTRLQALEAKVVSALAPPLYLDPVDSMEQAQELFNKLRDPRFNEEPPAPKSRKRTIAELAADEALAAEEQRFMLIMDERLQSAASATAAADTDTGGATFEPRFERFKAIEEIRQQHHERQREEAEAKAHAAAEKERALRERQAKDAQDVERQKQNAARQQQQQQQAARATQLQQQSMHSNQHTHGHLATASSAATGNVPNFTSAPGHHGSPAMRNMTPQSASSPVNAHAMVVSRSNQGGIPMTINNSRQGSGSPPRPGSALQHGHPMGMGTPQQPPSRNGTPHLPGGTPRMQTATPVMHNVSSTPRMSQPSPAMTNVAVTPAPAHAVMGTPQMGSRPMSQQQQQQMAMQAAARQRHQQQQQLMNQQAMARAQGNPSAMHMSPAQQAAAQQQRQQQLHQQQMARQAQLQQQQQAHAMSGAQMGNGHTANVMGLPGQQQQHQQQQAQQQYNQQQMQQAGPANQRNTAGDMVKIYAQQFLAQLRNNHIQNGQQMTQEIEKGLQMQAFTKAREIVRQKMHQSQARQAQAQAQQQQLRLQQQQQQQQQQMMMNGMSNGGMMGMNGMG